MFVLLQFFLSNLPLLIQAFSFTHDKTTFTIAKISYLKKNKKNKQFFWGQDAYAFWFRFKIRDLESSTTLFEIAKPVGSLMEDCDGGGGGSVEAESEAEQEEHEEEAEEEAEGEAASPDEVDSNAGRFVRYQFTPQVGC